MWRGCRHVGSSILFACWCALLDGSVSKPAIWCAGWRGQGSWRKDSWSPLMARHRLAQPGKNHLHALVQFSECTLRSEGLRRRGRCLRIAPARLRKECQLPTCHPTSAMTLGSLSWWRRSSALSAARPPVFRKKPIQATLVDIWGAVPPSRPPPHCMVCHSGARTNCHGQERGNAESWDRAREAVSS